MSKILPILNSEDMFDEPPVWTEFDEIPAGTTFYSRRGLAYTKTGSGSALSAFDEDVLDEDFYEDESVWDDWPYWTVPEEATGEWHQMGVLDERTQS